MKENDIRITSDMILDWHGNAGLEELAVYLSSILNGDISIDIARHDITNYFE